MVNVVGIKFKETGKVYFFDPKDFVIKENDYCVVETARGLECGIASSGVHQVLDSDIIKPLKPVVRLATEEDIKKVKEKQEKEKNAFSICEKKIEEHGLDMKLIEVEYAFDDSKVLFYFTADGRVDFRELVKSLASVFKTRIELRQIGVRDEAKMIGGLGICGREFCCSTFLGDFCPVSIKMAKEQGLSLNPTKMSGTCGRLMCCLKYEQEAYEDLIKNSPKVNSLVDTPDGKGIVTEVSLLTGFVKVKMENDESVVKIFKKEDLDGGNKYIREELKIEKLHDTLFDDFKKAPAIELEQPQQSKKDKPHEFHKKFHRYRKFNKNKLHNK